MENNMKQQLGDFYTDSTAHLPKLDPKYNPEDDEEEAPAPAQPSQPKPDPQKSSPARPDLKRSQNHKKQKPAARPGAQGAPQGAHAGGVRPSVAAKMAEQKEMLNDMEEEEQKGSGEPEEKENENSLRPKLEESFKGHKHHNLSLQVLGGGFTPKWTLDHSNAALYGKMCIAMVSPQLNYPFFSQFLTKTRVFKHSAKPTKGKVPILILSFPT